MNSCRKNIIMYINFHFKNGCFNGGCLNTWFSFNIVTRHGMKQPNEKQLYSNQNSMTNVEIYKMIFKNISWLYLCARCPIITEGGKVLNQEPIIFFFFKPTWVTRNWGNLSWQFLVLTLLWFTKFLEKLNIVNLIILLLLSEVLIVQYFDLMGLLWEGEGRRCSIQIRIQKMNPVCSLLSP